MAACRALGQTLLAKTSTEVSETISPATLAKRLARPQMRTKPSASMVTMSPVSYQPAPNSVTGGTSTPGRSLSK